MRNEEFERALFDGEGDTGADAGSGLTLDDTEAAMVHGLVQKHLDDTKDMIAPMKALHKKLGNFLGEGSDSSGDAGDTSGGDNP